MAETSSGLSRPYTQQSFGRRLHQFNKLMNEITLRDVEASLAEKRQLITENITFEDFCDSIRALFGSEIRNQDIKPVYQKISSNPDAVIDWSELFGYVDGADQRSTDGGGQRRDGAASESEQNVAAAVATGKNINVFAVNARRRLGEAAGNRFRRDIAVAIRYVAPLECYLVVSQRGTLSTWSSKMRLLSCIDVGDKTWASGCEYLPEIRKVAVCTERSICLVDIRANGKNQQATMISPLENIPQCIAHVPCVADVEPRDAILLGDDQGYVTLLTIDMIDLTGPKPTSIAGLSSMQKRTGKTPINIDPYRMTVAPCRRKLHPSWVLKIKYIPELSCFVSCCASEQSSFLYEPLSVLKENRPVKSVSVNKGVNTFNYCRSANIIATGGVDKVIRVWYPGIFSSPSGRLFGHMFTIVDIEMNEVDQHIISLSTARIIRVWDIQTLTALQVFNDTSNLSGEKRIYSMYFDSVREQLLTGSSIIDIWPLTRAVHNTIQIPQSHQQPISAMIYNREFHQLVSGCTETKLQFWDGETGKLLNQVEAAHGEYGELTAMAIDPTGYRLATGASDGSIKIWDFGSGQELKSSRGRLHAENCGIVGLFFCHVDGNRCLTAVGRGNHVILFSDAAKSQNLPMLREFNDRYTCDVTTTLNRVGNLVTDPAYFRRDSATSKDGEVPVTDDDNVTSLLSQREITCVASSVKPSNSLMMTGCSNGDIILWDVAKTCVINVITDDEILEDEVDDTFRSVVSLLFIDASCQSVDGAATNRLSVDNSVDGVQSDNENTQKEDDDASDPLKCQEADDQSLTSENGADSQSDSDLILASSHADGTVRIWTLEGKKLSEVSHRNLEPVTAMCANNAANTLLTGDAKGYIARWKIEKADNTASDLSLAVKEVIFWRAHLTKITQLVFVDKLNAVFSASMDASVRVWMPKGARYIGFLGQPRSIQYETKQRRHQLSSAQTDSNSLPHDITEGPVGPLKTASAMLRHRSDRQVGLTCPLVFDNARWRTKRPVSRLRRQTSKLSAIGRETSFVKSPAKKKFFDALLKRSVNQLDSYVTGRKSDGAIYRALPVYRVRTPDRPQTPQLSLPKLTTTNSADDSNNNVSTLLRLPSSTRPSSRQRSLGTSSQKIPNRNRKSSFIPRLTPNDELAE